MKIPSYFATAVLRTISFLLFIQPRSMFASILTRLPECGENQCHCTGAAECPALPTIVDSVVNNFRALDHANPMTIQCDPFASTTCVQGLTSGEACVVELIPPASGGGTCPDNFSYELKTVESLEEALAAGDYVTHLGPCGACSSLQDLATMITTTQLPMRGNDCYWQSGGLGDIGTARTCFENLGFTTNCARILASFQNRINLRGCPSFCAAFALGQGQDAPACSQSNVCSSCVDLIEERYSIVAGRRTTNSGYPSWSASRCDDIAPLDVVSQGDVCQEAKFVGGFPNTPAPVITNPPTSLPPVPSPTLNPSPAPTPPPTRNPTSAPTPPPTRNPTSAPTPPPTRNPTPAPTPPPTRNPTPTPTPPTIVSLNVQLCQQSADIETSLSRRTGENVVCDCSEAQNSAVPVCYRGPAQTQTCAIQFGTCSTTSDCCSAGVRLCRGGQCRAAARAAFKSSLRIGASTGGAVGRNNRRPVVQPSRGASRGRRRIRGFDDSQYDHDVEV
ncbi:filamentous hemagglutinin family outer membrane protein [Nitzschia inconspicua]|uniref:Filamentous hemagglutinin family outer membrane protein n=1 Tax=Nitzschia inconspicua TaxID=303405 RepID=A0A9K3Q288_9STRA|nr:filamentous hemagglutinin family outer membrane protein [Nitzschia inconspicua]